MNDLVEMIIVHNDLKKNATITHSCSFVKILTRYYDKYKVRINVSLFLSKSNRNKMMSILAELVEK